MALNVDKAVQFIVGAGFSHIKVELEGQLHRAYGDTATYNGVTYNLGGTEDCQAFIQAHLSAETRRKINFMYFYRDGSVDSEITFTLPTREINRVIEVIDAWNALVEAVGKGCDVAGAGMHFSVLTSSRYPTNTPLPADKVRNFSSEVTKLLPALYIASASGNFTRGLSYRKPQVHPQDKYSAIYTRNDTMMEFRIFETCYQRPAAVLEYLCVIARALEYYVDPSKKVARMNKVYHIYEDEGLKGFATFPNQIQIIKRQIKYLAPEGMTLKEFLNYRGLNLTIKDAKERQGGRIARLKTAYEEHKKAHEKVRQEPLSQYAIDNIEYWREIEPGKSEDWYWERVTGRKAKIESEKTYINNNLITKRSIAQVEA